MILFVLLQELAFFPLVNDMQPLKNWGWAMPCISETLLDVYTKSLFRLLPNTLCKSVYVLKQSSINIARYSMLKFS